MKYSLYLFISQTNLSQSVINKCIDISAFVGFFFPATYDPFFAYFTKLPSLHLIF